MGGGPRAQPPRWGTILSAAAFAALALYLFLPIARCLDECMVDYVALRGAELGTIELTDARLNTWILAWVQRALLADPTALFDANAFYPVPDALTQSEHQKEDGKRHQDSRFVAEPALSLLRIGTHGRVIVAKGTLGANGHTMSGDEDISVRPRWDTARLD